MNRSPWPKVISQAFLAAALTISGAARADSPADQAQRLFDEAKALVKSDKAAEACPKLEESQRLDPGMGTEYRLAECYEKLGRIASAYTLFTKVAGEARAAEKPEKEDAARQRAAALEPMLAKLALSVDSEVSAIFGLTITLDGATVARSSWGVAAPIDPGDHRVEVTAPGKKLWRMTVHVEAKPREVRLDVPPLEPTGAAPPASVEVAPPAEATPGQGWSIRRKVALGVGGVGVVGVVVGSVFGAQALGRAHTPACIPGHPLRCSPEGFAVYQSASAPANISNVAFAVGGAALIAGVVLFMAAPPSKAATPPRAARLSMQTSAGMTGFLFQGEW